MESQNDSESEKNKEIKNKKKSRGRRKKIIARGNVKKRKQEMFIYHKNIDR